MNGLDWMVGTLMRGDFVGGLGLVRGGGWNGAFRNGVALDFMGSFLANYFVLFFLFLKLTLFFVIIDVAFLSLMLLLKTFLLTFRLSSTHS
jgi:hypothetical protein